MTGKKYQVSGLFFPPPPSVYQASFPFRHPDFRNKRTLELLWTAIPCSKQLQHYPYLTPATHILTHLHTYVNMKVFSHDVSSLPGKSRLPFLLLFLFPCAFAIARLFVSSQIDWGTGIKKTYQRWSPPPYNKKFFPRINSGNGGGRRRNILNRHSPPPRRVEKKLFSPSSLSRRELIQRQKKS